MTACHTEYFIEEDIVRRENIADVLALLSSIASMSVKGGTVYRIALLAAEILEEGGIVGSD